jgi:hypothetical protein
MYAQVVGDNYRKQDITLKPTVKVSIQTCWGYVSELTSHQVSTDFLRQMKNESFALDAGSITTVVIIQMLTV